MGYSPWGCKRVGQDLATKQQQLSQAQRIEWRIRPTGSSAYGNYFFSLFFLIAVITLKPINYNYDKCSKEEVPGDTKVYNAVQIWPRVSEKVSLESDIWAKAWIKSQGDKAGIEKDSVIRGEVGEHSRQH